MMLCDVVGRGLQKGAVHHGLSLLGPPGWHVDSAMAQSQYLEPHKAFLPCSMQGEANCV